MASAVESYDESCSICQRIYTDLMSLNCGHNFCRECIVLDKQEKNDDDYSCPRCGKKFRGEFDLRKILDFSCNAEHFESLQLETDQPKILCSNCINLKKTAVKTCLHCEVHLCEEHLRIHSTSAEHVLLEPTTNLENRKCSIHKKILEYYCTEHADYICVLCKFDGAHHGHQVEKIDEVFKKLTREQGNVERKLENLQELNEKAKKTKEDITKKANELFESIRERLGDLQKQVLGEINRQGEHYSVLPQIQELKTKNDELLSRIIHIQELCHMTDQRHLPSDGSTEKGPDLPIENRQQEEFLIPMMLHAGLSDIMKMKDDLFPDLHSAGITLNVNTAAEDVQISGDLKSAKSTNDPQRRPGIKGRFPTCRVLSTNTFFSGKHYWVVESSVLGNWAIGMCYPSMKKARGWIGDNDKSWGLQKLYDSYQAQHNRVTKLLTDTISGNRFGVFLDYEAGRLSVYALCDPVKHLYTFTNNFTEPLHVVFQVGENAAHSQISVL